MTGENPSQDTVPATNFFRFGAVAVISALIATAATLALSGKSSNETPPTREDSLRVVAGLSNGSQSGTSISGSSGAPVTEDARLGYGYPGRVILRVGDDLKGEAGRAPAWVLSRIHIEPDVFLDELAEIIGATGLRTDDEWSTSIGSQDGLSPSVWLAKDQTGSFSAFNQQRSPWGCDNAQREPQIMESGTKGASGSAGSSVPGVEPTQDCSPSTVTKPSTATARAIAQDTLRTLGLLDSDVELVVTPNDRSVTVTAVRELGGFVLPWTTTVEVSSAGVISVYGLLAKPVAVSDYPVVDAVTAAQRSLDPYFSAVGPVPVWDGSYPALLAGENSVSSKSDATPSMTPGALDWGTSPRFLDYRPVLDVPVQSVEIVSAKMGVGQFMLSNGAVALLPAWEYTDKTGQRWSMIAVEDEYVNFTSSK